MKENNGNKKVVPVSDERLVTPGELMKLTRNLIEDTADRAGVPPDVARSATIILFRTRDKGLGTPGVPHETPSVSDSVSDIDNLEIRPTEDGGYNFRYGSDGSGTDLPPMDSITVDRKGNSGPALLRVTHGSPVSTALHLVEEFRGCEGIILFKAPAMAEAE